MRTSVHFAFLFAIALLALQSGSVSEKVPPPSRPILLWVCDVNTSLGVGGASVDIKSETEKEWSAHYQTDRVGRVLIQSLPERWIARVKLNGKELKWAWSSQQANIYPVGNLRWQWAKNVAEAGIGVFVEGEDKRPQEEWTSVSPALFRGYIQDNDKLELIPDVQVKAVKTGITRFSDSDGLFNLPVPGSFRRGKSRQGATETLIFSKPGYKTLVYHDLVPEPGIYGFDVLLEKGVGTIVRTSHSVHNSNIAEGAEFSEYPGSPSDVPARFSEIVSFEIAPYRYESNWVIYPKGARVIVTTRNVKSLEILLFPTGTGITESSSLGHMKKVRSDKKGEMWELLLPEGLMTTSFWAQGIDLKGEPIRSTDLGNVGCDDARAPSTR